MNTLHKIITLFASTLTFLFSQTTIAQNNSITVGGEVTNHLKIDAAKFAGMKHLNVTAISHFDHKPHEYSGVPLYEIIMASGAIPDNKLKGKYLAKYVLITGADGYKSVISLAEIDSSFTDKIIVLANMVDGKPIKKESGPFQIVVPGDKKPARCVRNVTTINVYTAKEN